MSAVAEKGTAREGGADSPRTFKRSAEARRTNYILAVGVASLWLFAVWSLVTLFEGGLNGVELVSLLLLGAMSLVAPLVIWTLMSDAAGVYEVSEEALHYSSLGELCVKYKWEDLSIVPDQHDDSQDDEVDKHAHVGQIRVIESRAGETSSRGLASILHNVSHGRNLPVFAGIEERDVLEGHVIRRVETDREGKQDRAGMPDTLAETIIEGN